MTVQQDTPCASSGHFGTTATGGSSFGCPLQLLATCHSAGRLALGASSVRNGVGRRTRECLGRQGAGQAGGGIVEGGMDHVDAKILSPIDNENGKQSLAFSLSLSLLCLLPTSC